MNKMGSFFFSIIFCLALDGEGSSLSKESLLLGSA